MKRVLLGAAAAVFVIVGMHSRPVFAQAVPTMGTNASCVNASGATVLCGSTGAPISLGTLGAELAGTAANQVVVTTGSGAPLSGTLACSAIQMCVYFDTVAADALPNAPMYIRMAGSSTWMRVTDQAGVPHSYLYANLPNASAWPLNQIAFVTDCASSTCTAGGGSGTIIGTFVNLANGWTLASSSGSGSSTDKCSSTVNFSSSMTFTQTCPDETFYVTAGTGGNTATITGQQAGWLHTYVVAQNGNGNGLFTCPTQDHGCFTVGSSPTGLNTQSFRTSTDGVNSSPEGAGSINVLANAVTGTMTIGTSTVGVVSPNFMGYSMGKLEMLKTGCFMCSSNTRFVNYFNLLGPAGTIRLEADSTPAPVYSSTQTGVQNQSGIISQGDIQNLANFMAALPAGWQLIYGFPFSTSQSAIANDGAEAAYVLSLMGPNGTIAPNRIKGFELANEPDGGGQYGTASTFPGLWETMAQGIVAVAPTAKFVGPALSSNIASIPSWDTPFLSANASLLSEISQHYYPVGTVATASINAMLTNGAQVGTSSLSNYVGDLVNFSQQYNLPIGMTETNDVANGGAANISNTVASALWALDYVEAASTLAGTAAGGGIGFDFTGYGGLGSAYSSGYVPWFDQAATTQIYLNPEFSGMYMAAFAGSGNILQSTLTNGGIPVTAYAISNGSKLSEVVVNESANTTSQLTITFPRTISSANTYLMTGTSLSSTTVPTVQGLPIPNSGSWTMPSGTPATISGGNQVTILVPAASAIVLVAQ